MLSRELLTENSCRLYWHTVKVERVKLNIKATVETDRGDETAKPISHLSVLILISCHELRGGVHPGRVTSSSQR